jgi:hypothetical protein
MPDDVEGIFGDCAFAFVPSDSLAPNLIHSVRRSLSTALDFAAKF